MMKLANRAGYTINVALVSDGDEIDIQYGEAVHHRSANIAVQPGKEDTVGAIVVIRRATDTRPLIRFWVPRSVIESRRAAGQGDKSEPWNRWWASMAQGAAIREAFARGVAPIEEMEAIMNRETVLDIQDAHAEPAAAAPPPARAFAVPQPQARAIAAPNNTRQIAGPPIEEDWTPPPYGDPVPAQQAAPPAQAAPVDAIKALRSKRQALVNEICDLGGIGGDTVSKTRAAMKAAGCAEVANPDEAALTTQIDLLTAHLAEAKVAALERGDGAPDAR
jgi:hypothetical protein